MASPLTIGTTATVVALVNRSRVNIRFQNTSPTQVIYIKKIPLTGTYTAVSSTDYEVALQPVTALVEGGEAFETNSVASFMAISSAAAGVLAVYETSKV
jgi:hypothetical protein